MIKGVNKKIIEINNPDSIYFEKAVFYLRPEVRELPGEITSAEVSRYVEQMCPGRYKGTSDLKKGRLLLLSLALAAAAALIFIFTH